MRHIRPQTIQPAVRAGRFLIGAFAIVFGGVGPTLLVFMWSAGRDEFGAPPTFFRIIASFIAFGFIAVSATMLYSAIRGGADIEDRLSSLPDTPLQSTPSVGYSCPSCGASLGEQADVSPMGDVKCTFCGRWFNVHQKPAGA